MTTITISIPDDLKSILDTLDYPIYMNALKIVAKNKIKEKEKRLKEVSKKIQQFEKKYKLSYTDFSKDVPMDFQAHEDWIDWSYLHQLRSELSFALEKYKLILNK